MIYAAVAYILAGILWILYLLSLRNRERSAREQRHLDSA